MTPSPYSHRCDVPTIDYSEAAHGTITCARWKGGCGRVWTRTPSGWQPNPRPAGRRP